ncbi:polysaccharide deacetylase family protein [Ornithinibacillus californiensis]|uniref:polysaccharide deacetylase family protein n=1 Tax=Ornithinibacillus californiensis TaxID=161536 RepID=UPI00064DF25A|nr:polysaccharide deacetylase family protein [Ornithinibacillus californiensis]
MYKYRNFINLIVFVIIVMLSFNINQNPFQMDNQAVFSPIEEISKLEDSLYKEIKDKSATYNEEPKNAYIDPVWKKIPGRNGRKVNIDASYERMEKSGKYKDELLVFDPIPPKVSLNDLEPAPIYRGHPDKQMVSFLINVSWGTEYIPEILNILKTHKVKATFFIEGKWAKSNVDYVKMIKEQGHTIGNHAYNHPNMARLGREEIYKQIKDTNDVIQAITGETPKWFAPPSGSFSNEVVIVADELQMNTILWSVDTIDWKKPSVDVMLNRVMGKIHPGATILMHPTPSVVNGLPSIITEIKAKEYKIGTIDKLLSETR